MTEKVLYEVRDGVAWATLNRPEVLNAIDGDVLTRFIEIVREVAADDDVSVLVWTGTDRAFSVGGDIKDMMDLDPVTFRPKAQLYQKLSQATRELDKPILAAINGYALGGGLELALMCDMRIAASSAQLGIPDAILGFSPTGGMTYLLPRIIGMGRTMQMALVPDPVSAEKAEEYGLVTQVVADDRLIDAVQEQALQMAAFPAHGLMYMKRAFYMSTDAPFAAMLDVEEEYDVACFSHPDTQAALNEFLESRKKKKQGNN